MKNLLLYGTTNYGEQLSTSDLNKFKELSQEFNIYIISQNKFKNIENNYVNIYYIKKSNNRYVNYLKFYFTKTITTFSKSIAKFSYKNCDFIRGVHELEVRKIAKKYNKEFSIFPAWVDYKTFYALEEKRSRKDLLFIGNVIPRKGVLFLLQAYNKFIETFNYKGKFLIVGDHPNEEYLNKCLNYVNDNNLRNVSFIGKKTPEEIANLMNNSAVLLMASSFEGLPRVLIESGLCKLPSISSDIDGISSPFGTNGGTMLYEHESIDKLVLSLRNFFQNDEIQIQLAKDSFELANKLAGKGKFLYNWKNIERSFYEE